jgi:hypothetical protein
MVVVGLNFSGKALILPMLALSNLFFLSTMLLAKEEISEKSGEWQRQLEMLRAVPYIAYSETPVDVGQTGVVFNDGERVYRGYNLYTRSPNEVLLLDMDGRVVHNWRYSSVERPGRTPYAIMLENGDLLVLRTSQELIRLSWDSQLIWRKSLVVHHDVAPAPDGSFYVVIWEKKKHRGLEVRFAGIVHLTAEGEEIDRWFSYDCLAEIKEVFDTSTFLDNVLDSLFAHQMEIPPSLRRLDYFHLNTIGILPANSLEERDSRFQRGNLLICFRNVNQIAVLEKDTYRVLWAWGEGELQRPHHPTMLENGHMLIFDNGVRRKYSRVVELDPVAGAIVWEYVADPPETFYSQARGSAQRFPNGNTLICESDRGRVFEVTDEGEVVWKWINPTNRAGRRQAVYRMTRFPPAQVEKLLKRWWWWN